MKLIIFAVASAVLLVGQTSQPPVYRATKVERTTKAVTFTRGQASSLNLQGTSLAPNARGTARIDARSGAVQVDINAQRLEAATKFGREYLTYVAWAITPEGRAERLGELQLNGNKGSLRATTSLQGFGLIITAEPYFAVSQPSDTIVIEGVVGSGTKGVIQPIDAKFELLGRGEYVKMAPAGNLPPIDMDPRGVLQVYQAVNAINIAKAAGAEKFAADELRRAESELQNAQGFLKRDKKRAETAARSSVQTAEDARLLTLRKIEDERQASERAAAAAAKQQAADESRRASEADAQRKAAEGQRQAADAARREAEIAAQRAAAESARAQQLKAEAEAARKDAEAARATAEQERAALRNQLRDQLSRVMATRESARGLIVDIGDVNFDTGKFAIKPEARERLARVSGILIATPGLKVTIEGHTDSVGSDELNQRLSEQRADSVRQYLLESGFPSDSITAKGFGKNRPVGDNATAAGRQQNRRVELIVSGERIGQQTID